MARVRTSRHTPQDVADGDVFHTHHTRRRVATRLLGLIRQTLDGNLGVKIGAVAIVVRNLNGKNVKGSGPENNYI